MPNADHPALRKLGISLVDPDAAPEAYAELLRVARRVRESHRRTIGLLPASPRVAIPAVAIQLGAVLADVCGGQVAFIDANTRWPALGSLALDAADRQGDTARIYLADGLMAVSHVGATGDRIDIAWLLDTLNVHTLDCLHVFVDLTGFPLMGEHARALDIVDGVLVVARAGVTKESELLARHSEVPPFRVLGVLLSG